jgi:hypothetical protein
MKKKTIALIGIFLVSIIGASSYVLAIKPEAPQELTSKAIPVYLFTEFQPGEVRSTTIDVEGYSKLKITYSYPANFLMKYSWGCEDPSTGQVAESHMFEIKPSALVSGTHPSEIAGSKLIIEVANQGSSAESLHIWLYVTP